jgi:hypothetical protein
VGSNVYSFAGVSANAIISQSYKYDTVGNAWTQIANLPGAREQASAVSDGTFAYIMGGADGNGDNTNTLFRYDPVGDSYTVLASNPFTTTWAQAGAYLNGKIYWIAGCGDNCGSFSNLVSVYDVSSNTWSAAANYPDAAGVGWLMATALGNYVYAAGGVNTIESAKTYRYDPTTNTWDDAAIADLPDGRWGAAEDNVKGKWLITGGYTFTDPDVVTTGIIWDSVSNTWSPVDPLPGARGRLSGATVGVAFHAIGGRSSAGGFAGTNDNNRYQNICQGPTATPTAAGVINGHLVWQSIPQPNARNTSPTGTLTICVSGVPNNYPITTDVSGNFVLNSGLSDGVYAWRLKGGRHLATSSAVSGTLTIAGGTSTFDFGIQKAGDIAAPLNNLVNASDFGLQKNQFGQGGNLAGDLDFNLVVNSNDFNTLKNNFGQAGAAANCP